MVWASDGWLKREPNALPATVAGLETAATGERLKRWRLLALVVVRLGRPAPEVRPGRQSEQAVQAGAAKNTPRHLAKQRTSPPKADVCRREDASWTDPLPAEAGNEDAEGNRQTLTRPGFECREEFA
jgi:hypothetical protein